MKTNLKMLFTAIFVLSVSLVWAQKTVTGVVTDQDGLSVPDATVTNTTSGASTVSDLDGTYSIQANQGDVIEVDAIGYSLIERSVGADNVLDFAVSAGQLDEVVVTALGISREKKSLGYATQEVSGDEVGAVPVDNFANALSGRVAGLDVKSSGTPGGSSNIVIRGMGSITGTNQALIVVDGTPINNNTYNSSDQRTGRGGYDYGNAAMDINPNDIESYNVLKGAAATALYGSRGANGVIIITTKKGKDQKKALGVQIYSSYVGGSVDKSTLPKYQDQYGAGYAVGLYHDDFYYGDITGDGQDDPVVLYDWDGSFGAKFDPSRLVYQWDSFYPSLSTYLQPRPWVAAEHTPNDVWKSLNSFENTLSITGGNEKGNFRLGITNYTQSGAIPNLRLFKNAINFSGDYNLSEKLNAFSSLNYIYNSGRGRFGTGYDSRNSMQTFRQWWQTNVDIYKQRDVYKLTGQNINWDPFGVIVPGGISDLNPIYHDNFYWMRDNSYQTDSRNRYMGNVGLNYKFTKGLNLLGRFTFDNYNELREERWAVGSTDPGGSEKWKGKYLMTKRSVSEVNYDLILSYNKDLSDKINLDANIGWNLRVNQANSFTGTTNGGLKIPGLYTLSNSYNPLTSNEVGQSDAKWMTDGEFARLSLGFSDTYYLEGSFRTDRSSTLPKENNRYSYFSVAGTAIVSKYINKTWLDYWKLRANYAEVGNAPNSPYQVFNTYTEIPSFGLVPSGSNPSTSNNPDLKPEKLKGWEIGTEAALFKERVRLDLSYYDNKTIDLLTTTLVSQASGVFQGFVNAGDIRNKGIELSLNVVPVRNTKFEWGIQFNWAKNKNKVEKLAGDAEFYALASPQGGVSIGAWVGNPLGVIVGTDYYYDNDGNKVVGASGNYLQNQNQIIGDMNPEWTGGVLNTFKYKNLSFDFLIDISQGGNVFSLDTWYGYGTGLYDFTAGTNDLGNPVRNTLADGGGIILEGVQGTVTNNPDGTYTVTNVSPNTTRVDTSTFINPWGWVRAPNKQHVYDASFVKLRSMSLSYNLPGSVFGSSVVQGMTLSLYGRNFWIIKKHVPYADPEAGLSAGNIQGYQSGAYPTFKEFGASVKINF